jgi:molybdopterin-guanine dinucleotide biosynthesis protein
MFMIELRTRPLRATHADAAYLVQRESDMATLISALSYGFNVMIVGERGSGKTTLVNLLAARLEEQGRHIVQLAGGRFDNAADALAGTARHMMADPSIRSETADLMQGERGDPLQVGDKLDVADQLQVAYRALTWVAGVLPDQSVVIVDGLAPKLVHEIFGRLRDEMWALSLQWVVTGNLEDKAILLAPPAEAFFEQVVTLAPFTEAETETLLAQRDPDGELDPHVRTIICERSAGNPSRALVLARQALVSSDPVAELGRGSVIEQIEGELGEPAARLADDLARNGPSGPSDPQLLRRIGWSRPRAYQVFQALQRAGYAEVSSERSGRAGRPIHTYRLKGLA